MTRLFVVVPCYNETAVIRETARRLQDVLEAMVGAGSISADSGICFVDDGSHDGTWAIITEMSSSSERVHGIKLSRNCGHQHALLAGLLHAPGDALISLDADLQDDPDAMRLMVDAHHAGADIVYGVRARREADTWFKRATARGFYRMMQRLGVELVHDHADYRLMSRRAVESLRGYEEANPFLRGIVPRLGFPTATVRYERHARYAGESKYPVRRMLAFAVQGLTSFSAAPLRAITVLGIGVSLLSFMAALAVVWLHVAGSTLVPGWASIVVPMFLLGGVQLLSLGVIGEYIAKIHYETKRRPRFTVEQTLLPRERSVNSSFHGGKEPQLR